MATEPRWRRTVTPRIDHPDSVIETTGESPQGICAMGRKIVKGRLGPVFEAIAPFAPTLPQRFNTVFLKVANLKVSLNTLAAPGVGN